MSSDERSMHMLTMPSTQTPRGIAARPRFILPTRSAQRHARTNDARLLVTCHELDALALLRAHDPFDLHAGVGDVVVWPERDAGVLVRLAFELAQHFAPFAVHELRPRRHCDFRDHAAHDL